MIGIICDLVSFFEGGLDYHKLKDTPLTELIVISNEANRIAKKREG